MDFIIKRKITICMLFIAISLLGYVSYKQLKVEMLPNAELPMLFVQEEYYDDLVSDVKSTNNVTISVTLSNKELNEILVAYDSKVPAFIENKEQMSVDAILAFIGTKVIFE